MRFIKTLEDFLLLENNYHFSYNCVSPTDYDELIFIIDNMKEINSTTFFRNVNLNNFIYTKKELMSDYHVTYYRCKKGNIDCYVLKHSAIEYVFKAENIDIKKPSLIKNKDYELLKTYNGYTVGDTTDIGEIKRIFHYLDTDKYQYEIKNDNKTTYYDSSIFENKSNAPIYTNLSVNVGEIYDEFDIYMYVQKLHRNEDDFYGGDLGERIEKCPYYIVKEIPIIDICIDEYELDDDYVDDYIKKYKSIGTYPPIVLGKKTRFGYNIIDGTHRANTLDRIGLKTIIAFVGTKNK